MKPALIFLLLVFVATTIHAQTDLKVWDQHNPLKWSDFKAPVDESNPHAALTMSGSHVSYHWNQHSGNYTVTFDVACAMFRDMSWTRVEKQSPELLKHEQVHFDIAKVFAKQLLVSLNNRTYTSDFKNEIDAVDKQNAKDRASMQLEYDAQTNHSRNKEMQQKWEAYVADLLANNYTLEEALKKQPAL